MINIGSLKQISAYEWEIPRSFRQDMNVPVRIFATRKLLEAVMADRSLEQAVNSATLPGLVGHVGLWVSHWWGGSYPLSRGGDLAWRDRL